MIIRPEEVLQRQIKVLIRQVEDVLSSPGLGRTLAENLCSLALLGRTLDTHNGASDDYARGLTVFPHFLEELLRTTDPFKEEVHD